MRAAAIAFVSLLSLCVAAPARANVVTLSPSLDNTLFSENGTLSNGAGDYVFAGTTDGGDRRRALMSFDIAAGVPAGSTITAVSLSLYMSRAKSNNLYAVSLHRVTGNWGEGTSHAAGEEGAGIAATTGDATWTHRLYGTQMWTSPGGDYVGAASASTPVGRDGLRYTWTGAGMVGDVQRWLDAPASSWGWILICDETTVRTAKRFDSRTSADVTRRPSLIVTFTPPAASGACCTSGTCAEVSSTSCAGTYQGDGTTCATVTCPLPTGACCAIDGSCAVRTGAGCSGSYQGDGTMCVPNPCPVPRGACCTSGSCSLADDPGVSCGGTYLGPGTLCSPDPCASPTGACCAADGSCGIVDHPGGTCGGTYQGRDSTCSPNPCPQPFGACCAADGSCTSSGAAGCSGSWLGATTMCTPNPCPQPRGACCAADGTCRVSTDASCAGSWMGASPMCAPNPCPQPPAACCAPDGSCTHVTESTCAHTWLGGMSLCAPNPCSMPVGACCAPDASCTVATDPACVGSFLGVGSTCGSSPCPLVLERYVDRLPLPAVATPVSGMSGGGVEYRMSIVQITQRLHRDLPPTTVWGYDDGTTGGTFPGPTIEARSNEPVRVTWLNDLRDDAGTPRTDHVLTVDPCPHGAERPGARTITHLHGGHVAAASDGYPESTILPGETAVYDYPNWQDAAALWYHDHALGITRLNVYMGLAGLYLVRDDVEDALHLPSGEYEVPVVIQDRTFNPDGSLSYPESWQEHFFGDTILVNGKVWPFLEVARGKYRLRLLNGSNSRTYTLYLSDGSSFTLIGGDGGLLEAPVTLDAITLGPGERADVIVDFEAMTPGTEVLLQNSAPAPYPGSPGVGVIDEIMKLVVVDRPGYTDALPATLRPIERLSETDAVETRDLELQRGPDDCGGRAWYINGLRWDDITEMPMLGTTEVWRFINRSGIAHPMHMHLVFFQVLDRQPFEVVGDVIAPVGSPMLPEPWETGPKDTVMVGRNEIVRVIAHFDDFVGRYPYHCHILEHEDHEMMRQFETVTTCGDGARGLPDEECDDGNTAAGDGCSPTCMLEAMIDAGVDAGADAAVGLDGGVPDAGPGGEGDGCGCRVAAPADSPASWLLPIGALLVCRRRRSASGALRHGSRASGGEPS